MHARAPSFAALAVFGLMALASGARGARGAGGGEDSGDEACETIPERAGESGLIRLKQYEPITLAGLEQRMAERVGLFLRENKVGHSVVKFSLTAKTELLARDVAVGKTYWTKIGAVVEGRDGVEKERCFRVGAVVEDEDECATGRHRCPAHSACRNTVGSYECVCDPGYEDRLNATGAAVQCVDVDECAASPSPCAAVAECARCRNVPGSFQCVLKEGARGRFRDTANVTRCEDVDECKAGTHDCSPNAVCVNTRGGYDCRCSEGYRGDGRTCQPLCDTPDHQCVDEAVCKPCATVTAGDRRRGAVCANETGPSYACVCKRPGLSGDGFRTGTGCQRRCDPEYAVRRGDNCHCRPGFVPVGSSKYGWDDEEGNPGCREVDECAVARQADPSVEEVHIGDYTFPRCDPMAACVNTKGSFRCVCPKGFDTVNDARGFDGCKPRAEIWLQPNEAATAGVDAAFAMADVREGEGAVKPPRRPEALSRFAQFTPFRDYGVTIRSTNKTLADTYFTQLNHESALVRLDREYTKRLHNLGSVLERVGYVHNAVTYRLLVGPTVKAVAVRHVEVTDADECALGVGPSVENASLSTFDGTVLPREFVPRCSPSAHCENTNGSYACRCDAPFNQGSGCDKSLLARNYTLFPYYGSEPLCVQQMKRDQRSAGCSSSTPPRLELLGGAFIVNRRCACGTLASDPEDIVESQLCRDRGREVEGIRERAERRGATVVDRVRAEAARLRAASAISCALAFDLTDPSLPAPHTRALTDRVTVNRTMLRPTEALKVLERECASSTPRPGFTPDNCERAKVALRNATRGGCGTASCHGATTFFRFTYMVEDSDGNAAAPVHKYAISLAADVMEDLEAMAKEAVETTARVTRTEDLLTRYLLVGVVVYLAMTTVALLWFGAFDVLAKAAAYLIAGNALEGEQFVQGYTAWLILCHGFSMSEMQRRREAKYALEMKSHVQ